MDHGTYIRDVTSVLGSRPRDPAGSSLTLDWERYGYV